MKVPQGASRPDAEGALIAHTVPWIAREVNQP
jgi:hypothetical protein